MATPQSTPETVTIQLTHGCKTIIDAVDADLAGVKWYAAPCNGIFYAYRSIGPSSKKTSLHRVILQRMMGRALEKGEEVDHIDGNSLNNCRSNLRVATRKENTRNRRITSKNTSGYVGVGRAGRRWSSTIKFDGVSHHIGYFDTPEEAHEAYLRRAIEVFGEFCPVGRMTKGGQ